MLVMRERIPVSVSVAVLIPDSTGKRVLLVRQTAEAKGKKWGPVAGGIEAHEDPMMAATRESREEVGVRVGLTDLVGIYPVDRGEKVGLGIAFRGKILSGRIVLQKEEILDWNYFSEADVLSMLANGEIYKPEYTRQAILDFFAGTSYPLAVIRRLAS